MSERLAIYTRAAEPGEYNVTDTSLHISSFVLSKRGNSILLVKAGPEHFLEFRRKKWLLPGAVLKVGEHPEDAAFRVLRDQLGLSRVKARFLNLQSHKAEHWDLCFLFEAKIKRSPKPLAPFYTETRFTPLNKLPRSEIAEDHLEVIGALMKKQTRI